MSETTHEVYGHVISVDALGEAHVVPLESTLSDIRAQLDVDEVALPTKADLELSWTETPKITGDSAMPMGDYELGQDRDKAETQYKVGMHGLTSIVPQEKHELAFTIQETMDFSDSALSVLQPVLIDPLPLSALAEQSRQFAKNQNDVYLFRQTKLYPRVSPYSQVGLPHYQQPVHSSAKPSIEPDSGYSSMTNTPPLPSDLLEYSD